MSSDECPGIAAVIVEVGVIWLGRALISISSPVMGWIVGKLVLTS